MIFSRCNSTLSLRFFAFTFLHFTWFSCRKIEVSRSIFASIHSKKIQPITYEWDTSFIFSLKLVVGLAQRIELSGWMDECIPLLGLIYGLWRQIRNYSHFINLWTKFTDNIYTVYKRIAFFPADSPSRDSLILKDPTNMAAYLLPLIFFST